MKTQTTKIALLSVLAIFASFNANAARSAVDVLTNNESARLEATPNAITINNTTGQHAWVTIYNSFGSIRDAGCVLAGQTGKFHNYYGPIPYNVRTEMTVGNDCAGRKVGDTNMQVGMPLTGTGVIVSVINSGSGYYLDIQ